MVALCTDVLSITKIWTNCLGRFILINNGVEKGFWDVEVVYIKMYYLNL